MITQQLIQTALTAAPRSVEVFTPLSQSENSIIQLSQATPQNPRVRDFTADTMLDLAETLIGRADLRLGHRPKDYTEITLLIKVIAGDIQKFPGLTRGEIIKAMDLGLDGEFTPEGERVYFSSSVFVQWVKSFIEKTKSPVMKKHAQLLHQAIEEKPAPSAQEQKRLLIEVVNLHVRQMRENPSVRIYGAAGLYQEIKAHGIWQMPIERANNLYEQALKIKLAEIKDAPLSTEDVTEIQNNCRQASYNSFISDLVESEYHLDSEGVPTPNE